MKSYIFIQNEITSTFMYTLAQGNYTICVGASISKH